MEDDVAAGGAEVVEAAVAAVGLASEEGEREGAMVGTTNAAEKAAVGGAPKRTLEHLLSSVCRALPSFTTWRAARRSDREDMLGML